METLEAKRRIISLNLLLGSKILPVSCLDSDVGLITDDHRQLHRFPYDMCRTVDWRHFCVFVYVCVCVCVFFFFFLGGRGGGGGGVYMCMFMCVGCLCACVCVCVCVGAVGGACLLCAWDVCVYVWEAICVCVCVGGGATARQDKVYIVASLAICCVEICMPWKAIKLKYTVIVPFWDQRHTNAYCMCL